MNWLAIICLTIIVISIINLIIANFRHQNLFFQILYTFIYEHKDWKRYRRLKQYLKTNTIPIINIIDYEGNNAGFAFIQYDDITFIIQGKDNIYLSSYFNHLINDLLKHNNHDS
jgi:hypothetical protein